DEAAPLPVLGDVAEAGVEHVARRRSVVPASRELDRALGVAAQAGDRVDQLGLAVAVDACDADDFPGAYVERDPADALDAALVHDVQVLDTQQHVTGL